MLGERIATLNSNSAQALRLYASHLCEVLLGFTTCSFTEVRLDLNRQRSSEKTHFTKTKPVCAVVGLTAIDRMSLKPLLLLYTTALRYIYYRQFKQCSTKIWLRLIISTNPSFFVMYTYEPHHSHVMNRRTQPGWSSIRIIVHLEYMCAVASSFRNGLGIIRFL